MKLPLLFLVRSNSAPQALLSYENRILYFVDRLDRQVACLSGQKVNLSRLLYEFGFDVMGDFAFGNDFSLCESEEWRAAIARLQNGIALLGPFSPVPWLLQIGFSVPNLWIVQEWNSMIRWCKARMDERLEVNAPKLIFGMETVSANTSPRKTKTNKPDV